jgi:hypothetical protein
MRVGKNSRFRLLSPTAPPYFIVISKKILLVIDFYGFFVIIILTIKVIVFLMARPNIQPAPWGEPVNHSREA